MANRYINIPEMRNVAVLVAIVALLVAALTGAPATAADGQTAIDRRSPQEQIELLEKFIYENGESSETYTTIGKIYLEIPNHPQAIESFRKAIELDSQNADAVAFLARAMAETGKPDEAEKLIDQAMDIDMDDLHRMVFLGGIALETGKYDWAENIADNIIAQSPSDFRYSDPWMLKLFAIWFRDGIDATLETLEKFGSEHPDNAACVNVFFSDMFIGLGKDFHPAAAKLLDNSAIQCAPCGTLDLRKGYLDYYAADMSGALQDFTAARQAECDLRDRGISDDVNAYLEITARHGRQEKSWDLLQAMLSSAGKSENPYVKWLTAILYFESGDSKSATEAYLAGILRAPVDFSREPGYYTMFSQTDYNTLEQIASLAESDMKTIALSCGHTASYFEKGSFYVAQGIPPGVTLLRYRGLDELDNSQCQFSAYAITDDSLEKLYSGESRPVRFYVPEDMLFVNTIYPSSLAAEVFWYIPIQARFPGTAAQ